jgi:hypothetical protein
VTSLLEIHYLPCIEWFALALNTQTLLLERHEHFVKQSFRNRCYINTEHGKDVLSVPLLRGKQGKMKTKDVRIDHSQKWINHHWRSIQSAYGKSPFFEYYADDLSKTLTHKHEFLYDLDYDLLTMCLRWLKADINIEQTLTYEKVHANEVWNLRNSVNDKIQNESDKLYLPIPYPQVFGNSFVENLSIIDLVFCCGPEAGRIVKASSLAN